MWPVQQESEVKYHAAPMFTLHQINAYEENGFLIMDMCCGDDGEVIGDFTLENLRRESGEEMDKVNYFSLQWATQLDVLAYKITKQINIFLKPSGQNYSEAPASLKHVKYD